LQPATATGCMSQADPAEPIPQFASSCRFSLPAFYTLSHSYELRL
jgi:hypothetical protein